MNQTAQKAIEAYGGQLLWSVAARLEAEFSANGLAFTLKRRPYFKRAKITMDIARPCSRITPIGKDPEITGVLEGADVRLENAAGSVSDSTGTPDCCCSTITRPTSSAVWQKQLMWSWITPKPKACVLPQSDGLHHDRQRVSLDAVLPLSLLNYMIFA